MNNLKQSEQNGSAQANGVRLEDVHTENVHTESNQTAGAQAVNAQTVNVNAPGAQTVNIQMVNAQTVSAQAADAQTTGTQGAGTQGSGAHTAPARASDARTAGAQTAGAQAGSRYSTMSMVQVAIFGAIICIMAFTPFLGYIPLGFTRATIIHVPVIIASLLMGPKKGGVLGFLFGLTSFINNTMNPTPTSFVFTPFYSVAGVSGGIGSVIICFIPRILVGILPFYVYKLVLKFSGEKARKRGISSVGLILAGISGALVNTLLVMNLIFVFFREACAAANDVAVSAVYTFILSVIGINGVPEAIVAGVLTLLIGRVLLKKTIRERLGFRNDLGY